MALTSLASIRIEPGATGDSLIASLRALLRYHGADADESDLAALTRLNRTEDASQHRHELVESAARLYGLELRDLHPPDAAPLPITPPEFAAHFRDSYLPFITQSLDRGKPAMAWMGWPKPDERKWGLIVGFDATSGQCMGITMYSSAPVAMSAAPVQVFVVVSYESTQPTREQIAAAMNLIKQR